MRMSSRGLLNLVLLLAVGALVGVAVFEPGIPNGPAAAKLTKLDPGSLTRVTLSRPGQADIILARDPGQAWRMEQPFKAPAIPYLAQNLSGLLSAEASADYAVTELDPVAIGLEPPQASLDLGTLTLYFGDIDPVHGNRYVQAGDRIHLIPDYLTATVLVGPTELVSPGLLPEGSSIHELRLPALPPRSANGEAVPARTLSRVDGKLSLSPPAELSSDDLRRWLDEWVYAQALALGPWPPQSAVSNVPTPAPVVELILANGDTLRFELIERGADRLLARPEAGLSYRFSGEQAERLLYPSATASTTAPPPDPDDPQQ